MHPFKHILLTAAAAILLNFNHDLSAQCNVKRVVKNCMESLPPYQYEAYAVRAIVYGPKKKKVVVPFSVYSDEEYKLVFGKTVLPQEIGITIYDDNPRTKGNIVYIDESGLKDNYVCNFKPTATGTYYIEYEVPAATAPNQKGCFVVLIGIKEGD